MENEKVFLRLETPFSLKNPTTRNMVLMMVVMPVMMAATLVFLYTGSENQDLAQLLTAVFVGWFLLGEIPCALLIFNGYAMLREGDLVVNSLGFFEKTYSRDMLEKAVKAGSRIEIHAGGKAIVSMPDSTAARNLVKNLRIPADWNGVRV